MVRLNFLYKPKVVVLLLRFCTKVILAFVASHGCFGGNMGGFYSPCWPAFESSRDGGVRVFPSFSCGCCCMPSGHSQVPWRPAPQHPQMFAPRAWLQIGEGAAKWSMLQCLPVPQGEKHPECDGYLVREVEIFNLHAPWSSRRGGLAASTQDGRSMLLVCKTACVCIYCILYIYIYIYI